MDGASSHPESFPPQQDPGNSPQGVPSAPGPDSTPTPAQGFPQGSIQPPYATYPLPYPEYGPTAYPGALPPPVQYTAPPRNSKRTFLIGTAVVAAVAALVGGVVFALKSAEAHGGLAADRAKTAIQSYLDALQHQDKEAIARHSLCGLYDGIKDHSTDLAVANLASDAFRRQFSQAQVSSIDSIVMLSPHQAQVLFTMKVTPSGRGFRSAQTKGEVQAVAQILVQKRESLVCSYLPRPSDSL